MTYLSEFKRRFPEMSSDAVIVNKLCPSSVFKVDKRTLKCAENCRECWNTEMKI